MSEPKKPSQWLKRKTKKVPAFTLAAKPEQTMARKPIAVKLRHVRVIGNVHEVVNLRDLRVTNRILMEVHHDIAGIPYPILAAGYVHRDGSVEFAFDVKFRRNESVLCSWNEFNSKLPITDLAAAIFGNLMKRNRARLMEAYENAQSDDLKPEEPNA